MKPESEKAISRKDGPLKTASNKIIVPPVDHTRKEPPHGEEAPR